MINDNNLLIFLIIASIHIYLKKDFFYFFYFLINIHLKNT